GGAVGDVASAPVAARLGERLGARAESREGRMKGARIAVVGGGLAGLAAAVECADAGADVTLYEARRRLGGATFSVDRKGYWTDNGQHIVLRCCIFYLEFLRRLGVDHLVAMQPRLRVPVLREGKPPAVIDRARLPAPLHLVPALLRYEPLRGRERLAALPPRAAPRNPGPDGP